MDYLGLIILILLFVLMYYLPIIYKNWKFNKKLRKNNEKNINGYVYIMSNPAFKETIYKIGQTSKKDINERRKGLDNTSVPLPFEVEILIPHHAPAELENYLHKKFKKYRLRNRREFFSMNINIIEKELIKLNY